MQRSEAPTRAATSCEDTSLVCPSMLAYCPGGSLTGSEEWPIAMKQAVTPTQGWGG